jgi:NAD-reducing hydrogenase large subunit
MLHCAEKVRELLDDPDLQGTDLLVRGERRPVAAAWLEAPRGTLFHRYSVGPDDLVRDAKLVVATTNNNEAINRSIRRVARDSLRGRAITQELLDLVEMAVRAYDPCLSCATHALGTMPLVVTLEDADGRQLSRRVRN